MSMHFGQGHDPSGLGCTKKSYFVQNQAISFTFINVTSQSNNNESAMRWRTSLFALAPLNKSKQAKLDFGPLPAGHAQRAWGSKICTPCPSGKGKANKLMICKPTQFDDGPCYATQKVARRSSAIATLRVERKFVRPGSSIYKAVAKAGRRQGNPIVDLHHCTGGAMMQAVGKGKKNRLKAMFIQIFFQPKGLQLQGHEQTQRAFRKDRLKMFQVKEYVTFSKLVPKELFLIQSIQNPCKTHYTIVRPLINCSRHTITMACFLNRLPVYSDITNKKVRYSRNRIRKQVIPSLQFFFNPEVEKALFKFSELRASGA